MSDHSLRGEMGRNLVLRRPLPMLSRRYSTPLTASSHIAAKCHSKAPPNQPPRVMLFGMVKSQIGEASKMRQPLVTIRTTATTLIQWVSRSHAGWMTLSARFISGPCLGCGQLLAEGKYAPPEAATQVWRTREIAPRRLVRNRLLT